MKRNDSFNETNTALNLPITMVNPVAFNGLKFLQNYGEYEKGGKIRLF